VRTLNAHKLKLVSLAYKHY